MRANRALAGLVFLLASLAWAGPAPRLDDGLLDPEWFGIEGEWKTLAGAIDYLWVRPGFDLTDRTVHLARWSAPVMLNGERDAGDSRLAYRLTDSMPGRLAQALAPELEGIAGVSRNEGDLRLTGRFVDCNAGSRFLRWLSGAEVIIANATWDLKLVDAATGETVAAVHHRAVSGADSRNLGEKIDKWLARDFAPALRHSLSLYETAPPARE
jgi:hypothetical protein